MAIVPNKDGQPPPSTVDVHLSSPRVLSKAFSDNFNRPDTLTLSNANWTLVGLDGGLFIKNNAVSNNAGAGLGCWLTPNQFNTANHYAQCRALKVGTTPGYFLACRLADYDNYVGMTINTGTGGLEIWRKKAGSWTAIAQNFAAVVVGDTIRLECNGTTCRGLVNGVLKTTQPIGDATLTSVRTGLVSIT